MKANIYDDLWFEPGVTIQRRWCSIDSAIAPLDFISKKILSRYKLVSMNLRLVECDDWDIWKLVSRSCYYQCESRSSGCLRPILHCSAGVDLSFTSSKYVDKNLRYSLIENWEYVDAIYSTKEWTRNKHACRFCKN